MPKPVVVPYETLMLLGRVTTRVFELEGVLSDLSSEADAIHDDLAAIMSDLVGPMSSGTERLEFWAQLDRDIERAKPASS